MNDWIDRRTRWWALLSVITGIGMLVGMKLIEDPHASALDLLLELLETTPVVLTSVGVVLLFRVAARQREEHLQVIRDLELARVQGQRWRADAHELLEGLGTAIQRQFAGWNLTAAEAEVALLLLKGLSHKDIGALRAVSERTVREQARSVYGKAGLTGRTALSAYFLEDLLAPTDTLSRPG